MEEEEETRIRAWVPTERKRRYVAEVEATDCSSLGQPEAFRRSFRQCAETFHLWKGGGFRLQELVDQVAEARRIYLSQAPTASTPLRTDDDDQAPEASA